jgi:hypothetical protein
MQQAILRPCWVGLFERSLSFLMKIRFTQKQYQFGILNFFKRLLNSHRLTGCAQLSDGIRHIGAAKNS